MQDLIISTIAFFVAAFFINRALDKQDINKGMARSIMVFVLASIASYGASAAAGWMTDELGATPKPVANAGEKKADDISQLLRAVQGLQNH
ncbi:MAG TPA: hypothetical protein VMV75_05550 [Sulfuricella sp.]|nr:hypothetical protein [Sulfuricella sp.]